MDECGEDVVDETDAAAAASYHDGVAADCACTWWDVDGAMAAEDAGMAPTLQPLSITTIWVECTPFLNVSFGFVFAWPDQETLSFS